MKQSAEMEAMIEDVIMEPTKIQPIIVNFQNGELKDEEANTMSCGLYYDQKKKQTLLALSNGQIVYKGYRPNPENELTRTMLVFHNKKTGKVRLVQAERWQVSPVLQKPTIEESKSLSEDKVALLNKQFGSKKIKRKTEQYERMKVNVESVRKELEQTVANIEIERSDLSIPLQEDEFITNTSLPECNRNATNVNDVYNLNDILPQNKLETLFEKATELLDNGTDGKASFFTQSVKQFKSDPDGVKKVALLLYIQGVSTWLSMPIKDAKKRGIQVCPASQEVNSYIIDTYSVGSASGRLRPNSMKDKGVIHCLILGLMIFNFTLDLESFAPILGGNRSMGLKKLTSLARVIGALPNKDDKKIITLKVPLPAPIAIARKGKKKISS